MNEIVNKFFLAGDKFVPKMHLKQPGFSGQMIKHLILLKILNMMDINAELPQWFTNFLINGLQAVVLICMQIIKLNKIIT